MDRYQSWSRRHTKISVALVLRGNAGATVLDARMRIMDDAWLWWLVARDVTVAHAHAPWRQLTPPILTPPTSLQRLLLFVHHHRMTPYLTGLTNILHPRLLRQLLTQLRHQRLPQLVWPPRPCSQSLIPQHLPPLFFFFFYSFPT